MILGAHVSISKGLAGAIEKACEIGADCIQIFSSPPRNWRVPTYSQSEIKKFKKFASKFQINPIFIHGTYLVNLAADSKKLLENSINSLITDAKFAKEVNAAGVIFHLGSTKEAKLDKFFTQLILAIEKILENSSKDVDLIIENATASKNSGRIGGDFREIGRILKAVTASNLKVCLDTAHAFTAGYQINTKVGLRETLAEFDKEIGLENLVAIHLNDSKAGFGSGVDRHENIGEGFLGLKTFELIVNHSQFKNLPGIIETPGFDKTRSDRKNLEILRSLVKLE